MVRDLAPDVAALGVVFVNIVFVGTRDGWTLVDAGLPHTVDYIRQVAEQRFGPGARPGAIVLTHGHFDHIGALVDLAGARDVPVYAHALELPFLTGQAAYPPPLEDAPGLMARTAPIYPRNPVDLGDRVRALPADGSVPTMPGWRAVRTPGHTPGHIALFREADRLLIPGDAVATRSGGVEGMPPSFTPDREQALASIRRLRGARAGGDGALARAAPEGRAPARGAPAARRTSTPNRRGGPAPAPSARGRP